MIYILGLTGAHMSRSTAITDISFRSVLESVAYLQDHRSVIFHVKTLLLVAAKKKNCGLGDKPGIKAVTNWKNKFCTYKCCVDLIITVCAGRLIPWARVFVVHRT